MTQPMLTREEFIKQYAVSSNLSFQWAALGYIDFGSGRLRMAMPCDCGQDVCAGWVMLSPEAMLDYLEFHAPEKLRDAYRELVRERGTT